MSLLKSKIPLCGVALVVGIAVGYAVKPAALAGEQLQDASSGDRPTTKVVVHKQAGWLQGTEDERFQRVEHQLRGFDVTMVEVGYRFTELYFAGLDRNWDYAKYQSEKIETTIRLGLERRPKRMESAKPFLEEDLPTAMHAIQAKDPVAFEKSMDRLRSACMQCHVKEEVPYFTVYLPERRISPIRTGP